MSNNAYFDFNGSSSSGGGGMSRTDYLAGHYWRLEHWWWKSLTRYISCIYCVSRFTFTGQRLNQTNWTTGAPLGTGTSQVTIQVY